MTNRLWLAMYLVAAIALGGCSTTRLYEGPAMESAEVATISGQTGWNPFGMFHGTAVYSLDGVELDGRKRKVELEPGVHSVGLVSTWLWWTDNKVTVEQEFKAGEHYVIGIQQGYGKSTPALMGGLK